MVLLVWCLICMASRSDRNLLAPTDLCLMFYDGKRSWTWIRSELMGGLICMG